ncbi:hypothetical protein PSEUDO8Z_160169 [Pseudomonas sp. 8Z]|uniref:hypothetical protein n=1 Tax=Pseudomonas sp. 8Z TaxID=2653166 RepID=UPI0012F25127|nr:hypothetical protein [Pseudomonas sp. 8Z]VXC68329.1 hypothetical protein PSEUDO8Z_160169 [Pseudomonas sp. 8Z]
MHRIDVPSAAAGNQFTEGSPAGGVPATTVTADWLNDVQGNIAEVVEAAGIELVKGDFGQLLGAIQALSTISLGAGGIATNDYVKIPFKDKATGSRRELIFQFGVASITGGSPLTVTLPIACTVFNKGFAQWGSAAFSGGVSSKGSFAVHSPTLGTITISPTDATGTFSVLWFSFGV